MTKSFGYAAHDKTSELVPYSFERRDVGENDVLIDIVFSGICHSDIHQVRDEWGGSIYPMVPGHEIVGKISQVGANVKKFKVGDLAGVGCMVDSCRECEYCSESLEQFCTKGTSLTYNSLEQDKKTPTLGGYSTNIVVDEAFALKIQPTENLAAVAPLLCAGITTYSPLKRFGVKAGQKVGVVGLGGLGHMGVKFAVAMGAEVTVFSTSPSKEEDARNLGAHNFVVTKNPENMAVLAGQFDLILDAVSAPHDINQYINLLRVNGTIVLVGAPEKPLEVGAFNLIMGNRSFAGSAIGGINETQDMLDFCAEKGIVSDIELISVDQLTEAYERAVNGDVRYRFVIDIDSMREKEANN